MVARLILILGDQLSDDIAALRAADPTQDVVVMAEVLGEAAEPRHHPKKIAFLFAAMRKFAARLGAAGWRVAYGRLDDPDNAQTIGGELLRRAAEFGATSVLATEPGPIMAAVDSFAITVQGRGGHAALPHLNRDPIPPALAIAQAVPTLVSHTREAADRLVVAVTQLHAGTADNITPDTAWINGTVRSFDAAVQARVEARLGEIVQGIAAAFGVTAVLDYQRGYPATINDPDRARFAAAVAAEVAGEENVIPSCGAEMGAEDFSYLLEACPGAYLYLGQGPGPGLHHPGFDFDDAVAPVGASFLARVAERAMPV